MCSTYNDIGRPKYPYAEFRSLKGRWQRMPLSDELLGRAANVTTSIVTASKYWTYDLKMKKIEEENPGIGESYGSILAKPTNC